MLQTAQQFMAFCGVIFSEAAICQIISPKLWWEQPQHRTETKKWNLILFWVYVMIVSAINANVFLLLSCIFRGKPFLKVACSASPCTPKLPTSGRQLIQYILICAICFNVDVGKNELISLLNAVIVIEKFSEPKRKVNEGRRAQNHGGLLFYCIFYFLVMQPILSL